VTREQRIQEKLSAALSPSVLEVANESSMHNVPKGSETHFKVVVVSLAFEGLPRVRRHQLVYGALADEMTSGLHALAITSKTPAEWSADAVVPASPECLGGSKR
jgi:stress-induced morphogen